MQNVLPMGHQRTMFTFVISVGNANTEGEFCAYVRGNPQGTPILE